VCRFVQLGVGDRVHVPRRHDDVPIARLFGRDLHRARRLQRRRKLPASDDDVVW
jgi:hypothetical protein